MLDDAVKALARLERDPSEFSIAEVPHNRWLTPGIWQVTSSSGRSILKCLGSERGAPRSGWDAHWTAGSDDPGRWNYWAREGLAYLNGTVDAYETAGIVAPHLISSDHDNDHFVLLLDFADGQPGEKWDIDSYAAAAAALGSAQGRMLTGSPALDHPWLSRGFLRQYSSEKPVDWTLLTDDEAWAQPLVRRNFPPELREAALWLHTWRERLYGIAEALPRTVCHLDFWTKNLIMRPEGTLVLLDWSFVGDGAIGEDIGNLVPDASFDHFVAAEKLPDLESAVFAAYTDKQSVSSAQFKAAAAALDSNSVELSKAVGSVSTTKDQATFLQVWRSHITNFVDYAKAEATSDEAAKAKALKDLDAYRSSAGDFFAKITKGALKSSDVATALKAHIESLAGAIDSLKKALVTSA